MSEALAGLRVVELGFGPATGVAGMILADFGAEVVRITPPDAHPLDALPAEPMWARGKESLTLDIKNDADRFEQLLAAADVLLTNLRMSTLRSLGMDYEQVHARHPHLVYGHISGFGNRGPLADLPGYEHVVAAYAGRMLQFQGLVDRTGPVVSAVQVGVHAASQSAVTGILAAVYQRSDSGAGRLVETSILQGMLPYEMGSMIGHQFEAEFEAMMPYMSLTPAPPLPSLYYHPAQAGDGRWMQMGNLLPHLFDNFLIVTELIDVLADPAFDPKQMLLRPEENHEAFRERMLKRMQDRPSHEWMADYIADGGIVGTTYQTTQEALKDPDVVDNGHVIALGDEGGVQLGPLARLTETPATPGGDADFVSQWTPRPAPSSSTDELPLAGVKVVELATIIAAPIGASFLADLGADVIKVEQLGGDPFRSMLAGLGASRVNVGKRSVSVDLKSDDGKRAVMALLKEADIVLHNYRPGVPERLGIDYESVKTVNPDVIYIQSNGYGPDGPGAHRPSTHPIPGAAMGGVMYQMGEKLPSDLLDADGLRLWTSRLMRGNELNPDPNTGLVLASTAMLGLVARQRTGRGQQILMDMFGANAYANADDFLSYPGKKGRALPDDEMFGYAPTYRLYRCAEDDWVFLGLVTEGDKRRFTDALVSAGLPTPEMSEDDLCSLFLEKNADAWQSLFVEAGVACVRADRSPPPTFWLNDEQTREMSFVAEAEHPALGLYLRHGSLSQIDGQPGSLKGPPLAGQHNAEILTGHGYSEAEVQALTESGVLWSEVS